MFLSKLVLNVRDRQARYDLARSYELHRTLMNGYAYPRVQDRCDLLFRVESTRMGPPVVLVQTREKPDWSRLPVGYLLQRAEFKPLDLAIPVGKRLRFRLRANPTKRVAEKNKELGGVMAGKRVGVLSETEQIRWLIRKGEAGGFRIPGEWVDAKHPKAGEPVQLPNFRVDVVPEGRDPNGKPGHEGVFIAVRFEGVLEVTDPDQLRKTVSEGIGSAKAFGFGLLSLARAEE
ncbi:MAG: type I-E CRISPR-associated protein Cas6/Cse3/CasE [Gemmataceae bacterium]